jgi:UTP--glucose-1-phosphate uridylyltransferase
MSAPVRKAVIPAAGYGTRFLPISKSVPKEMLPILDKPVIQYVVEEAVASGITDLLIVISRSKRAIEEHFFPNRELEDELEAKGKAEALAACRAVSRLAKVQFVWQHEMRGLGDAVSYARDHVSGEPFALLMGDTIVEPAPGGAPVTRQLCDVWEKNGGSAIAIQEVAADRVSRYGIVGGSEVAPGLLRVDRLVEKPAPADAPSRLAITSRYVLSPRIFPLLEATPAAQNGEVQLTDALLRLIAEEPVFGWRFGGRRFDIGDKAGFVKTNIEFALRDPALASEMRHFLAALSPS